MAEKIVDISHMVKRLENPPNRIREQRLARKLTLLQVAQRIGTTQNMLSRFETGERDLTLSWLRRIARALGTDVGQLLNPDDNFASLDDDEAAVIDAMRHAPPGAAPAIRRVAEEFVSFGHREDDQPRRRA